MGLTDLEQGLNEREHSATLWKWMLGAMFSVIMLGGGAWVSYVQAQINDIRQQNERRNDAQASQGADIAVIKEKIRAIEQNVQETKEATRETSRKLDELIRQQQQQRNNR
jgi:hypothetical protein